MSVHVKNDVKGLRSLRSDLRRGRADLEKSFRRLSSGFEIQHTEKASLELASTLRARIRRFSAAERSTTRAIHTARAAEGGLGDIGRVVERMRGLAGLSTDAGLTVAERGLMESEFQGLKDEILRLNESSELHDPRMMYAAGSIDFQLGPAGIPGDVVNVDFAGVTLTLLGLQDASVADSDAGRSLQDSPVFDEAIEHLGQRREHAGKLIGRLERAVLGARAIRRNLQAASSEAADIDEAEERSVFARAQLLLGSGMSVLAQGNQGSGVVLHLLH
jgi:flagellin